MLKFGVALSLHLLGGDMNFFHPYVKYQQDKFIAGVFYNSEKNASVFVGVDLGDLELGLVTGYTGADVAPYVRYTKNFSDEGYLFVTPDVRVNGDVGVTVGIGYEF